MCKDGTCHSNMCCLLLIPSVAFGMRKALTAEQGKADMEQRIKELEEEKRELEQHVSDHHLRSE